MLVLHVIELFYSFDLFIAIAFVDAF